MVLRQLVELVHKILSDLLSGLLFDQLRFAHGDHQPQYLPDAPCLRAASSRSVWRFGVKDLAHATDTAAHQMLSQTHGDGTQLLQPLGVNATPRVDEWADQPWPDSPLVICEVPRAQVTKILRLIIRVTRRQRTQSKWSEQLIVHDVDNRLPVLFVENRMRQRNRKQLIRPDGIVITILAVELRQTKHACARSRSVC